MSLLTFSKQRDILAKLIRALLCIGSAKEIHIKQRRWIALFTQNKQGSERSKLLGCKEFFRLMCIIKMRIQEHF